MHTAALFTGAGGMLAGAFLIARRDRCARAMHELCRVPERLTQLFAGAIAGTGFSLLVGAAWIVHAAIERM